jgi:acetylornithine deacetylase/succinyl-diaminopimelate desuccinylase-like protein
MTNIGLSAELHETGSKPVVFAEHRGESGKPVVLFYGHYDVQPVDPLDEWTTPPFNPTMRNGRIYARGASDNKGQFFYVLKALETLIKNDALGCSIKALIEGEEENGSAGMSVFLRKRKEMLKSDILLVTDVDTVNSGAPTIIMGLRGLISITVRLSGPIHDLHSGMHGGLAPNPAQQMVRLIATLHNTDGSIAVEGFNDDVRKPSEKELMLAESEPFNEAEYHRLTGVPPVGGEKGFNPAVRLGFRPTIEINGISSGYGGAGSKTIIPSTATAKITARLAPDQDPLTCLQKLERHLRSHAPSGLNLDIPESGIAGPPIIVHPDNRMIPLASKVMKQITGRSPVFMYEGASIPIIAEISKASGSDPLLAGFGSAQDRIHAPNESFSIDQFKRGFLYAGLLLGSL